MTTPLNPKKGPNGRVYLNIGCGSRFHRDWNNLDLLRHEAVTRHDIRKGLPYSDASIDYAYSSHVLEHLDSTEASRLLRECFRVLKPGGIIRVAVPDLEGIVREYLERLSAVVSNPSADNVSKYDWIVLELIDQMTRRKGGGLMRPMIDGADESLRSYMIGRIGDFAARNRATGDSLQTPIVMLWRKIRFALRSRDPRATGELHRWMYDRFSLARLLESSGFCGAQTRSFRESEIADWLTYDLDSSDLFPGTPRKPDSIFMEAKK